MSDYTPLGMAKLAQQATRDLTSIRCPRDSVVMRFLNRRLMGDEGGEVDLECPACGRRAYGVEVGPIAVRAAIR
jgi:hypothetical protein